MLARAFALASLSLIDSLVDGLFVVADVVLVTTSATALARFAEIFPSVVLLALSAFFTTVFGFAFALVGDFAIGVFVLLAVFFLVAVVDFAAGLGLAADLPFAAVLDFVVVLAAPTVAFKEVLALTFTEPLGLSGSFALTDVTVVDEPFTVVGWVLTAASVVRAMLMAGGADRTFEVDKVMNLS